MLEKTLDIKTDRTELIKKPNLGFLLRAAGCATTRLVAPPAIASTIHAHWKIFPRRVADGENIEVSTAKMKERTPVTRVRFASCVVEIRGESCASDEGETFSLKVCSQGVAGTADVEAADIGLGALMDEDLVVIREKGG